MPLSSEALILIIRQIQSGKTAEVNKDDPILDAEEGAWLNHLLKMANPSIIAIITLPAIDAYIRDLAGDNGKENTDWRRVRQTRDEIYQKLTSKDNQGVIDPATAEILLTSLSMLVNHSSWAADVAFYTQSR